MIDEKKIPGTILCDEMTFPIFKERLIFFDHACNLL